MQYLTEPIKPERFTASGSYQTAAGSRVDYEAVSEDNFIYADDGHPLASIFSYSYFRKGGKNRPVAFIFNGGPGAGCFWLHIGIFGPKRIHLDDPEGVKMPLLPPFAFDNNPLCPLDICDLVFIDPVGTGYGRLLDEKVANQFYGVEEDAESVGAFICSWLNRYKRWDSPKFIFGESYGTLRASMLCEILNGSGRTGSASFGFNGMVLIGSAIGTGRGACEFPGIEESLLTVPSMAAANWYHHHPTEQSVEEFVGECYAFCEKEYCAALYKGSAISEAEADHIAERIAYFSGLSKDYVLKMKLRPSMIYFLDLCREKDDLDLGGQDGRFTLPKSHFVNTFLSSFDNPLSANISPAFISIMNGQLKQDLNISFDRRYYGSAHFDIPWNYNSKRTAAQALSASMRRNQSMKLLFASGYFDLRCPLGMTRYLANHIDLDGTRVELKEYVSGHMVYIGDESAKAFSADVRQFILENS